jgi:DNA mismatch repair protein MutS2
VNAHALRVLGFSRILELVAERTTSVSGAVRVRAFIPHGDRAVLERDHARVAAMRALRASPGGWGPDVTPVLDQALEKLAVAGASWSAREARCVGELLASAARTKAALQDPRRPAAAVALLDDLTSALIAVPPLLNAITGAIDNDGAVKDSASPALRRIRRDLREAEHGLLYILEQAMARLDPQHQVPDASVTVRNGRYVIPVRRDARSMLGGIVHDTSATGATLFVEPPAAIEAANRIRELEIAAQREVDRVLLELTDKARGNAAGLAASHAALTELDVLHALARFADEFACGNITFGSPREPLVICTGRHPLLIAQGVAAVPFDLVLDAAERTLLVSGPNTGGKTVLLTAVGLFHAMAQSGIPVPAGAGTTLPIVDDIFADIGDEQSIQASLSTFSAHILNLRDILLTATSESLVLIDELGSGTDPAEGAALGAAILEELTHRGVRTIATTHLGALKDVPLTVPGVVNASLQFDEQHLAPTYHLLQGIPGRSYGLSIARRLQIPEDVLARAEARVPEEERAVTALLAELERRERALVAREQQLATDEEQSRARGRRVADRERAVTNREREVERDARRDARRYLLEARADVERTIASLRAAADADRSQIEREARRLLEMRAAEHADALASLDATDRNQKVAARSMPLAVGDTVAVDAVGGRTGRIIEFRDDEVVVALGVVRMAVQRESLRPVVEERVRPTARVTLSGSVPELNASPEVDLRGIRVAEVEERLLSSIDAAVRADLKALRIVHGKGTGALRERVAEMLQKDVRVRTFRLGAWNEGGAGVTIAEFA